MDKVWNLIGKQVLKPCNFLSTIKDASTAIDGVSCFYRSGEFRKLLAAFVSGSAAKSGGIIRKITPTSAELRDTPTTNRSQQKLQVNH